MAAETGTWLRQELAAIVGAGLDEGEEALSSDALRTFLVARPDLRETMACQLYERGTFSLGQPADRAGLSMEAMKEALERRRIGRAHPGLPAGLQAGRAG